VTSTSSPSFVEAPAVRTSSSSASRLDMVAVVSGVAFGLTAPLTVVYAVALGAGGVLAGTAVSSMSVTILALDVFGTRWLPRLPPRRAIVAALLVFGAGSLISAVAPSLLVMILARCLQGVGAALFQGAGPQLAVRLAGEHDAGRALGRFQAAWFLGIALGPFAGGALAATAAGTTGLRVAFAGCAVVSVVGAVVVLLLLPRTASERRPELGLPRLGVMLAARPLTALGIAAWGQAVRSGIAMTLVPLAASQRFGLTGLALGATLSVLAVSDVVSMSVGGRLADRWGRLPVLLVALSIGVVAVVALAAVGTAWAFAGLCLLIGVPVGVSWVVPAAIAVDLADSAESGLAAYRIAADVGLGVGGVVAGTAIAGVGIGHTLLAAGAALVVPIVLVLLVGETRRRSPAADVPVRVA
jgi:predicted MFS family arabinose efflux permease